MAFEAGQRVGDYEILGLLGTGGMGSVYRARNIISDRVEAMKVLLPDLSAERDLAIRFISEIRTLAGFDHPNIALLHTAFQTDNQLIMVMEYVEGYTLEQRAKQGPMTGPVIAGYICQALSALSYAHARNVVHRDIKPANLMVTPHGVVKLMDFGIAKSNLESNLTRPGTTIGSLYYMSPEQVRGSTVDARSDLYSISIVLYELLAGRRPFESDSTYGVLNQQLNSVPQPPIELNTALPVQLNAIILKALAKDPADRFQTADEFRAELKRFAVNEMPVGAPAISAGPGKNVPNALPSESPAFQPVPVPQQPYAAAGSAPARRPARSSRPLWIATGALVAIMALVGVASILPRLFKTHASESSGATRSAGAANQPPTLPPSTVESSAASTGLKDAPPTAPLRAMPTPAHSTEPSGSVSQVSGSPAIPVGRVAAGGPGAPGAPVVREGPRRPPYVSSGAPSQAATIEAGSNPPQAATPQGTQPSQAELDQLGERFIQLDARAQAVENMISQLRAQQEADGLGLRGDMESADTMLRSYMQAADQDVRSSRVASGSRNMDKAEKQVVVLEKFLGL